MSQENVEIIVGPPGAVPVRDLDACPRFADEDAGSSHHRLGLWGHFAVARRVRR